MPGEAFETLDALVAEWNGTTDRLGEILDRMFVAMQDVPVGRMVRWGSQRGPWHHWPAPDGDGHVQWRGRLRGELLHPITEWSQRPAEPDTETGAARAARRDAAERRIAELRMEAATIEANLGNI